MTFVLDLQNQPTASYSPNSRTLLQNLPCDISRKPEQRMVQSAFDLELLCAMFRAIGPIHGTALVPRGCYTALKHGTNFLSLLTLTDQRLAQTALNTGRHRQSHRSLIEPEVQFECVSKAQREMLKATRNEVDDLQVKSNCSRSYFPAFFSNFMPCSKLLCLQCDARQ